MVSHCGTPFVLGVPIELLHPLGLGVNFFGSGTASIPKPNTNDTRNLLIYMVH